MTKLPLDRVFALVEQAAISGARCPQNDELGVNGQPALRALALSGRVRIKVGSRNWRQVEILTGPHAGKQTADSPHKGSRVYLVLDKSGTRVNGKLKIPKGSARTAQPSAPRPLRPDELR